jgi:hypothetical protein
MSIWMLLEPKEQLLAELFRHLDHPDCVFRPIVTARFGTS